MTYRDAIIADRLRKGTSWAVFLALLTTNVVLAVNLTAARHELSRKPPYKTFVAAYEIGVRDGGYSCGRIK